MPDADKNFGRSLICVLENHDLMSKPRIVTNDRLLPHSQLRSNVEWDFPAKMHR